jgi:hypothetical protein
MNAACVTIGNVAIGSVASAAREEIMMTITTAIHAALSPARSA